MKSEDKLNYGYRNIKNVVWMAIGLVLYKMFIEIGFWFLTQKAYEGLGRYHFEISISKWFIGNALCAVIFLFIRHEKRCPSTFFLELVYLIMIVPMAVMLAFSNESILFFGLTCGGFVVAEWIILLTSNSKIVLPEISMSSSILIAGLYCTLAIVLIGIIAENGMFTLEALNIYNVYDVRGDFKLNKYIGYMFEWQYSVIIPFFIVRYFQKQKYIWSAAFLGIQMVLYLYSGQKGILFIIPLTIGVYFFAKLKRFSIYCITAFCGGVAAITIGSFFSGFMYNLQDLFVRRVLILPAWLKYLYFDFFQQNFNMGLAGTLWGKFLGTAQPYKEGIGYVISDVYFGLPEVNSNTGFIAEGISRFGIWGVILTFILFAFILLMIDRFAEKNGYAFAISLSLFSIILLNDGAIIDTLIFGHLLILVIICLLYNVKYDKMPHKNNSVSTRTWNKN